MGHKNDASLIHTAVRQNWRKVRNVSRGIEGEISQVKWWLLLDYGWVEAAAENVESQVWVSQGRECLLLHLHRSLEDSDIDKEQQISVC